MTQRLMIKFLLGLSFGLILFSAATNARAANYTVDTTADDAALTACTAAANDCSLRGAISAANAAAGADTINFDQAIFSTAQTIAFTSSSPKQHLVINSDLTIDGPGANLLTIKGYPIGNGTYVSTLFEITGGMVAINNLKLTGGFGKNCYDPNGSGFGCGGAISMSSGTLTVSGTTISGNTTTRGGGIYTSGGTLNITDSTISGNNSASTGSGGGIYVSGGSANIVNTTISGNIAGYGGGVNNSGGTLNINNSAVSGNTAQNRLEFVTLLCQTAEQCQNPPLGFTCSGTQCTGYVSRDGIGGGILNNSGTTNIKNSTISGNNAQGYATTGGTWGGGGIWNRATLTVANSTITGNYGQYGGGIGTANGATSNLSNSIVAGNSRNTSAYGGGGADIYNYPTFNNFPGGNTMGSYNLVQSGDTITGTNNITGQAALLGPLANNGGPTQTHALLAGSPAIDAGDPNFDATTTPFDQRDTNYARKYGSAIDIGAFEYYPQIVNTLTDHDDGACSTDDCTLREAVKYAADGAIITFGITGTITLTQGEIVLVKNVSINGPTTAPGITISGNNQSRIFSVGSTSGSNTLSLSNLTLTKGNGVGSANNGTGGAVSSSGTLNVANCTFTANTATSNGGAIRNSSILTVTNSTFSGNSATGNGGAIQFGSSATITNSTFSGNTATGNGGGINNNSGTQSTSPVTLSNSIVAGNSAPTGPDFNGKFTGGDYNLIQNTSGATLAGTHNITGQTAHLGALADNGGATKTMALLANSPAIDTGDPNFDASATPFDQRGAGFLRKVGNAIDIGTFEIQPASAPTDLTIVKTHAGSFIQGDSGKIYTITVTNSGGTTSSGTISVNDSLPAGLTATAIGGTGWNCNLANLTCTRNDTLGANSNYPAITLIVNVDSNAPSSVTNTATVSGGGETNTSNNSANDPTTINVAPRYSIAGTIRYGITTNGQPDSFVSGVTLNATGTASVSATSDSSGIYSLTNLPSGDYTVTPSKSGDVKGINSLDATRIQQQLVGMTTLTANQLVAADTDGNGTVNSLDATRIQQSLIGMQTTNIIGQWKFVPANRQYNALGGNQTEQDYQAVLIGEVSGNWATAASLAGNSEAKEEEILPTVENQAAERFKKLYSQQTPDDLNKSGDLSAKESLTEESAVADIQVSLPTSATGSTGSTVTIPITISQIPAGQSIESFDFSVFYNSAVLQPAMPSGSNTGTLSANCSVLSNSPVASRVIVSGACAQAITTGSGVLYNLTFNVIGTGNQTSSLSFTNPATNIITFQFNNGTPTVATANGSFTTLVPTAASVSVSGRVLTPEGKGLMNAVFTMTDSTGAVRYTRSSTFGYFHFENVAAGQTCVFQINSKRYTFTPQVLTITDNVTELNFTAQ